MYGRYDFSCDLLGLLEIEGWVSVCVLCVLNLKVFVFCRSVPFDFTCSMLAHVLDFFKFPQQPNILFEEEQEHVLHDDWEEHNVKNFFLI